MNSFVLGEMEKGEFMKAKYTMKELPVSERPYEKAEAQGAGMLSDKELLTVLIRTGTKSERADQVAMRILEFCGKDGLQALWNLDLEELKSLPGIGRVKAIQILCVCELAKRLAGGKKLFGEKITSSEDVAYYYSAQLKYTQRECLILLVLDSKNRIISEETISVGNINASIADPREVYLKALKKNGVSVILLHNHPSGDPSPSIEDIRTTERMAKAGELLGIPLKDHIIIGQDSFISLNAEGYLKFE